MLYLDESNNEHEIELGVGEEFELHLPENPTTGFRWKCIANGGSACVLQSDNFESVQFFGYLTSAYIHHFHEKYIPNKNSWFIRTHFTNGYRNQKS